MSKKLRLASSLLFALPFIFCKAKAQDTTSFLPPSVKSTVGLAISLSDTEALPFWLRSNRFGDVAEPGLSASPFASIYKVDDETKQLDWSAGLRTRLNVGEVTNVKLIEVYAKLRWQRLVLKVGRTLDQEGLVDSALSAGSFSISGNALGIPKVSLEIKDYYPIPIFDGLFSIRGNFSYGWIKETWDQLPKKNTNQYHHLGAYVRFGKPNWKLKLYGAVNHDVIYGQEQNLFGNEFNLSPFNSFIYAVTGKAYMSEILEYPKVGNHLGALDIATTYQFENFELKAYRQFFYEKGALYYLANIKDGLTGLVLTKKPKSDKHFQLQKIVVEFLYSKSQAGEIDAKKTPSGPEYYYNHTQYLEGFSYNGESLGTPLFTPVQYAKQGDKFDNIFFVNTRVIAWHLATQFKIDQWQLTAKSTFSRNYGDYRNNAPEYQYILNEYVKTSFPNGKFQTVNQFSGLLEASKPLKNNFRINLSLAMDAGKLLRNDFGTAVTVSKSL